MKGKRRVGGIKRDDSWYMRVGNVCTHYFGGPGDDFEMRQAEAWGVLQEFVRVARGKAPRAVKRSGIGEVGDPDLVVGRILAACWAHFVRGMGVGGSGVVGGRRWCVEVGGEMVYGWEEGGKEVMEDCLMVASGYAGRGVGGVRLVSEMWVGGKLSAPEWGNREYWDVVIEGVDGEEE